MSTIDFGSEKEKRSRGGGGGNGNGNGGGGNGDNGPERPRRRGEWTTPVIAKALRRVKVAKLIARDELTMADMLLDELPNWSLGDYPRLWTDEDTTAVSELLPGCPVQLLERCLRKLSAGNGYNPLQSRFESLPRWDGHPRVEAYLSRSLGLDDERLGAYHRAVSQRLIWAIVSRAMAPGCKYDCMVILEGRQGIGKSRFCRLLAFEDRFFTDSLPPLTGMLLKDAREALMGKSIVEMAELMQFKGSRVETLKTFLSTSVDSVRLPYLSRSGLYPRSCVILGSTNESEYLTDQTGNRRFWPLMCGAIDMNYASEVRDQVYAEALLQWREAHGQLQLWLPDDIEILATSEQEDRTEKDPEEADVIGFINGLFTYGGPVVTSARAYLKECQHWDDIQLTPSTNPNARVALMRIARIMRQKGGILVRSRERLYKFPAPIGVDT